MAWQARFLAHDLRPTSRGGAGPQVVLVHGLYATAGVFRPLRRHLESELGAATHTFSYPTGPGIRDVAARLEAFVRDLLPGAPLALLGHSMGGLAIRLYLRQRKGGPPVKQTVSLATPYKGSPRNHWVWGQAGRDARPEAPMLAKLRAVDARDADIPHLSIVGADDRMIAPEAYPDYGKQLTLAAVGHNGLLFDPRVRHACVQTLKRAFSLGGSTR